MQDEYTTEQDVQDILRLILEDADMSEFEHMPIVESVSTFNDDGVMTNNAGLVVRFADRSEYQITIVRSR